MSRLAASATQGGFALIAVLWAGVLLCVVGASLALTTRDETRRAESLVQRAKAEAIAEAGIQRGISALLAEPPGPRRESDGRVYELPFGEGSMRIRLTAEDGKIDLNGAPDALIRGLLRSLAASGELPGEHRAERIAGAILDWRDPDHWLRDNGAEDRTYAERGFLLGARDGPFVSVAELNLVLGVDAEVYARLAPWVTVYSWSAQVDPVTAPRAVLRAIPGLDAEQVDQFIAARNAWLAAQWAINRDNVHLPLRLLSPGARYLTRADAHVYTVDAVGVLTDGTRASRRAVVRLTGRSRRPYTIMAWFESIPDSPSDSLIPGR